jgi:hypothetical protein
LISLAGEGLISPAGEALISIVVKLFMMILSWRDLQCYPLRVCLEKQQIHSLCAC